MIAEFVVAKLSMLVIRSLIKIGIQVVRLARVIRLYLAVEHNVYQAKGARMINGSRSSTQIYMKLKVCVFMNELPYIHMPIHE